MSDYYAIEQKILYCLNIFYNILGLGNYNTLFCSKLLGIRNKIYGSFPEEYKLFFV